MSRVTRGVVRLYLLLLWFFLTFVVIKLYFLSDAYLKTLWLIIAITKNVNDISTNLQVLLNTPIHSLIPSFYNFVFDFGIGLYFDSVNESGIYFDSELWNKIPFILSPLPGTGRPKPGDASYPFKDVKSVEVQGKLKRSLNLTLGTII